MINDIHQVIISLFFICLMIATKVEAVQIPLFEDADDYYELCFTRPTDHASESDTTGNYYLLHTIVSQYSNFISLGIDQSNLDNRWDSSGDYDIASNQLSFLARAPETYDSKFWQSFSFGESDYWNQYNSSTVPSYDQLFEGVEGIDNSIAVCFRTTNPTIAQIDFGIISYWQKHYNTAKVLTEVSNLTLVHFVNDSAFFDLAFSYAGTGNGSVTLNPPDATCVNSCINNYTPGTVVTLTPTADTGSTFVGWAGDDCSGIAPCTVTMDSAKQVIANFDVITASYTKRVLSQTRYDSTDSLDSPFSKNYDNDFVNTPEDDLALNNAITHILYPYQSDAAGYNSGNYTGFHWPQTGPASPIGDLVQIDSTYNDPEDTREPLILIHGWQASCEDCYPDYENREPSLLGMPRDNNNYDAEDYWANLIRFFALSEELKTKYKLYIYQYPSYKHVTFNGRILGQLLHEIPYIRTWINDENKSGITIIAHSMGGLVSRAMLEQHGVLQNNGGGSYVKWKNGEDILHKLYTLSTPHHGSPAAIPSWVTGDSIAGKDLRSPGAFDLWWDGYDDVFKDHETAIDIGLPDEDFESYLDNCSGEKFNAFYERNIISRFDFYYRAINTNLDLQDSCWTWGWPQDYSMEIRHYPNPWLRNLNYLHKQKKEIWKTKYFFYGGYDFAGVNSPIVDDSLMNLGTLAVLNNGYLSDAVVPITSMFLESIKIPANELDRGGFPDKNSLMITGNTDILTLYGTPQDRIYIGLTDGYNIRLLKDYHHDRVLNGAYKENKTELTNLLNSQVYPDANDIYSTNGVCERGLGHFDFSRFTTGFMNLNRSIYVNQATNYIQNTFDVQYYFPEQLEGNCRVNTNDYKWITTLKHEPIYMLLEAELLGKQLSSTTIGNSFPWTMFLPAIMGAQ